MGGGNGVGGPPSEGVGGETWAVYLRRCREALQRAPDIPDDAAEFRESVQEKLSSMAEWIEKRHHVTPKMQRAIDNMADGVAKFFDWGED